MYPAGCPWQHWQQHDHHTIGHAEHGNWADAKVERYEITSPGQGCSNPLQVNDGNKGAGSVSLSLYLPICPPCVRGVGSNPAAWSGFRFIHQEMLGKWL